MQAPDSVLLAILIGAAAALAQKSTGEIQGTVFDPSNTVIPKAVIVATDVATGIAKTMAAGANGAYLIPNLLAGSYEVTVTAPGFKNRSIPV